MKTKFPSLLFLPHRFPEMAAGLQTILLLSSMTLPMNLSRQQIKVARMKMKMATTAKMHSKTCGNVAIIHTLSEKVKGTYHQLITYLSKKTSQCVKSLLFCTSTHFLTKKCF